MIPVGVQVFVALTPVDMRSGFERLAGWVCECMGYEARSGALFVFVGKRRTTLKVVFFDGTGMCLFHNPPILRPDRRRPKWGVGRMQGGIFGMPRCVNTNSVWRV